MKLIKEQVHKKIKNFIENYRHVIEVALDAFHFFVLPPLLVYLGYHTYWLWNASFVEHSTYVDIQFSLRGNTVSVSKKLEHDKNYYWLYEIDWPNRLIDIYQLDKEYRIFARQSRYIYRYERPDLLCKKSEGWDLINRNLNAKSLFVKFRNFFYREYCQNVHHYIREKGKKNKNFLIASKNLKIINDTVNKENKLFELKNNNAFNLKNDFILSFINDTHPKLRRKNNKLKVWECERNYYSEVLGKKNVKDIFYKNLKLPLEKKNIIINSYDSFFEKFKIKSEIVNDLLFSNNSKNYSKAEKLKLSYNGENFFSPFDLEIKRLEIEKKIIECKINERFRFNVIMQIAKHDDLKDDANWKQHYLHNLDFKSKKKLLLESRLRNRIFQKKFMHWSLGKRVPYRLKHDNLLDNKVFKTRDYYYDTYKEINSKRRFNTNHLSFTNWGNNCRTQKKYIYKWDDVKDRHGWDRRSYRGKLKLVPLDSVWDRRNVCYYGFAKESYFLTDFKSKRRFFMKRCKSIYRYRNVMTYKRPIVRAFMGIPEELYDHYFKNESLKSYEKLPNPHYRRIKLLKTEMVYNKNFKLTKNKTRNFISFFPLKAKQNAFYMYDSKTARE